jgi:hypothetical protein
VACQGIVDVPGESLASKSTLELVVSIVDPETGGEPRPDANALLPMAWAAVLGAAVWVKVCSATLRTPLELAVLIGAGVGVTGLWCRARGATAAFTAGMLTLASFVVATIVLLVFFGLVAVTPAAVGGIGTACVLAGALVGGREFVRQFEGRE